MVDTKVLSIVSSDWSDKMVWFGQILLLLYFYHPMHMILEVHASTKPLHHLHHVSGVYTRLSSYQDWIRNVIKTDDEDVELSNCCEDAGTTTTKPSTTKTTTSTSTTSTTTTTTEEDQVSTTVI